MGKEVSEIRLDNEPAHFPPWSKDQQDAQIEALRFAFHCLARTLHESGRLSIPALIENLDSAQWLFADTRPDTREAVRLLAEGLDDTQQKVRPLPRREQR